MFDAKVVLDSVSPAGARLTTMEWTYPRFIHSEIMTHRDRARNAASSRAIPWPKMMQRISDNPVVPLAFGMEQPGMQAGEPLPQHLADYANEIWMEARDAAMRLADKLHNIGRSYYEEHHDDVGANFSKEDIEQLRATKIHKSIPNRITEPWMWITVVMTATDWNNLFRQRCHPDAEIHFQKIAGMAREALVASTPTELGYGDWHMPYITEADRQSYNIEMLKRASVARCARVSYMTHGGEADIEKDQLLFERLVTGSGFGHWSPHEHVARPAAKGNQRSGPFRGWIQLRKSFANECADETTPITVE